MEFIEELRSLKEQVKFDKRIENVQDFDNMVIAGMGGSGICGKIFQELYSKKPVITLDDYHTPEFVSDNTLFIGISYSGNTEETISAINEAKSKGARIITISAGGALEKMGYEHISIPLGLQPRSAGGYMLVPLLNSFGMMDEGIIERTYALLDELDRENSRCMAHAKRIATGKKIPVIFGASPYRNVAMKWKNQFNENAKVIAYANSFPELNHNDTMALAQTYRKKNLYFFAFGSDYERIEQRIQVTKEITDTNFRIIKPKGKSTVEKLFYLIHYGDYISYHLAGIRGINPTDVSIIEELKRRLH
ncbi:MAG: bifunctional phosphoglucose/phosphomannose isomerase [Candidatus Micrarchaeota archaeon]|nr:bifunctional phosphoglucose/phosphomannose isomerase [Candidatus Micrarchaeota archaeon]MDE1849963.1 bifunctional phosphoglucose/phosphomannose isomerase [Candidatus Micrarchaeota archaeon]